MENNTNWKHIIKKLYGIVFLSKIIKNTYIIYILFTSQSFIF